MSRARIGGRLDSGALATLAGGKAVVADTRRADWRRAWLQDRDLTPPQRAVLETAYQRMSRSGFTQGNSHHFATGSGLPSGDALRVIDELVAVGWLTVERTPTSFRLSGSASAWLLIYARFADEPRRDAQ